MSAKAMCLICGAPERRKVKHLAPFIRLFRRVEGFTDETQYVVQVIGNGALLLLLDDGSIKPSAHTYEMLRANLQSGLWVEIDPAIINP